MTVTRPFIIAAGLVLTAQMTAAQDLSRYRVYGLESSVDAVVAASGARAADVKTLHEHPATIQELTWRAPYVAPDSASVDPVREIAFAFINNALYQITVSYDRDRTEGLTNQDIIESLSGVYGPPAASAKTRPAGPALEMPADGVVLARWENAGARLTLVRGAYSPEFQLILVSKSLSTQARAAIRQSAKLDAAEKPRRAEDRKKQAEETRLKNKAAFRA